MMDASASFTDTGNASPATATGREAGAGPESPSAPRAASRAGVSSGDLSAAANADGVDGQNHHGCVPEPVSMILTTGGLLGLIGARRFRK
jgi:hypothetical protein